MARGPKHYGVCHICGTNGKLSFEHIPPEKAFNDRPIMRANPEELFKSDFGFNPIKGKIQQRGSGDYTLCERCNNNTGDWYASDYIDWCFQGMDYLRKTKGHPHIQLPYYIFPLRVIKQIITMFFSTVHADFQEKQPELVKFILDKEEKYLPSNIHLYCYYATSTRQTGISGMIRMQDSGFQILTVSEFAFPPFGYLMTFDCPNPDKRLVDISFLANYSYNEWTDVFLALPYLPTELAFPGDYRTREEIIDCYERNLAYEKLHLPS